MKGNTYSHWIMACRDMVREQYNKEMWKLTNTKEAKHAFHNKQTPKQFVNSILKNDEASHEG